MIIDYQDLSAEALQGIAKEYILANVSETQADMDLESWIKKVTVMIRNGELLVEFSEANESVYLKTPDEINMHQDNSEENINRG